MLYLFLLVTSLLCADVDSFLEANLSPAAIKWTKKIDIPNYPHAYNPSLIPYKEGYLLSFRYTSQIPKAMQQFRMDASFIGIAKLDKDLNVVKKSVQLLNVKSYSAEKFSGTAEDARLFQVGDRIYIFFNDLLPSQKAGFAMYICELEEEKGYFFIKEPARRLRYPFMIHVEKNWTPFFAEGEIHVIYSDDPRIILKVDPNTGLCQQQQSVTPPWDWDFGQIRGGTPALLLGDQFITFFHSSFPASLHKGRAYVMGAYLFDSAPPFTVRFMTINPLGALSDYTQDNSSKIVFPAGLVILEDSFLVAWGKADRQIQVTSFDRKKLLESLCPL